jgi:hypothetical protein
MHISVQFRHQKREQPIRGHAQREIRAWMGGYAPTSAAPLRILISANYVQQSRSLAAHTPQPEWTISDQVARLHPFHMRQIVSEFPAGGRRLP